MGTFRTLGEAEARAILDEYGLRGPRSLRPIAAGTINTNFAVEHEGGRAFLRFNEGKDREDVEREAAIVAHVAARGVPTPAPLRARSGLPWVVHDGVFVSLFPWVEGRTLARGEVGPQRAREAGAALGRLHAAGADFPDRRPGRYEPPEIERRLRVVSAASAGDPALEAAVAVLAPALERLGSERRSDLPTGLIHADLFIDNVLFSDDGGLVALLDFEQAAWGRLAYDVAVSLLAFGFGTDDFRPEVTRAFIEGYAAVRRPTETERLGFAAELRFAACRFAITRITDVYLRRTPGAPPGKDFRRYLQRLARVEAHVAAADGLLTL
jgi:homoserine kinase type II